MQRYEGEPHERVPLDSHYGYESPPPQPPMPPAHRSPPMSQPAPSYHDSRSQQHSFEASRHNDSQYGRPSYSREDRAAPANLPGRHTRGGSVSSAGRGHELAYVQAHNNITPGMDNFSDAASGGMSGIAYSVADSNARESGVEALRSTGQVPPPPSKAQFADGRGLYPYYNGYGHDQGMVDSGFHGPSSFTSLTGSASATPSINEASPRGTLQSMPSDPYADDPYQAFSARKVPRFGIVDPNDIEDDGDDGLHYARNSQRNSMLSSNRSDRGGKAGAAAAAAGGAAGARGYGRHPQDYSNRPEKSSGWLASQRKSRKWRLALIIGLGFVILGAIVGGVVGGVVTNNNDNDGSESHSGESAGDDTKNNGDLDINSDEIKALLNNPDLHKVFPGMDYTPFNTQYPGCLSWPPSQNNVTRDVAVLSQLTNKIRLYGTDCNQTQMVLHALDKLEMKDTIKVWMGIWQDGNATTNARQLSQMWDVLDEYGQDPFEGIIVANEVLFRKEMTVDKLGSILDEVRTNLSSKSLSLEVATSDLGDDWTSALSDDSDYVMANIHPFFAGVEVEEAAGWAYNFWTTTDKPYWKSDKSKNIISETGWPTGGGHDCGEAKTCSPGAVAGIDELNTFMSDWVCQALDNGTNYFWFEAFDEPWKVSFNEPGKEWEDKWGLMDADRKLKPGVKIPDCGGKTVA